jgi:hypothetical protein
MRMGTSQLGVDIIEKAAGELQGGWPTRKKQINFSPTDRLSSGSSIHLSEIRGVSVVGPVRAKLSLGHHRKPAQSQDHQARPEAVVQCRDPCVTRASGADLCMGG